MTDLPDVEPLSLDSKGAPSAPRASGPEPAALIAAGMESPKALEPTDDTFEETSTVAVVEAAEQLVQEAFRDHDPSHDFRHVHRVRLMALSLTQDPGLNSVPDTLVVELSALLHDMVDRKYLPPSTTPGPVTAHTVLAPFFKKHATVLGPERIATIARIVDNVSWSKDQARRTARLRAERSGEPVSAVDQATWDWERSCIEYQIVSDADRLDAIGSFGILRCAAYAAAKNNPLHVPPKNSQSTSAPPYEQSEGYSSSAIAHFYSKLTNIRGDNLWTETARQEAERRQSVMSSFLTELDLEWMVAEQGTLYSHTGLW